MERNDKLDFRAKIKNSERFVYGYPIYKDNTWYIQEYTPTHSKSQNKIADDCNYNLVEIDINTLSRYIGINDKNNNKIYENDYLIISNGEHIFEGIAKMCYIEVIKSNKPMFESYVYYKQAYNYDITIKNK